MSIGAAQTLGRDAYLASTDELLSLSESTLLALQDRIAFAVQQLRDDAATIESAGEPAPHSQ